MINVEFEWDPEKSRANLVKHGIDFSHAVDIWHDSDRIEIILDYEGENRFATIGLLNEKIWTAVLTYREKKIRLISVRRARKDEEELYHEKRRY